MVVNAAEGEPASLKDRAAARRACPTSCSTGPCSPPRRSAPRRRSSASARRERRPAQRAARDRRTPPPARAVVQLRCPVVPDGYVSGPGVRARKPSERRPRASRRSRRRCHFERGVRRPPDARQQRRDARPPGADRSSRRRVVPRSSARPTSPGSALVTLSGPIAHPGVYEIEHGASLSSADRRRRRAERDASARP